MRVDEGEQVSTYWFHMDHLGSTSLLSDIDGEPVPGSHVRYLPYGEYRTTPIADLTDVGYTGHRQQDELGLLYARARFYLPSIGRFLSADSIVPDPCAPQLLNRFTYAAGNPLRLADPSGHYHKDVHYDMTAQWVYESAYMLGIYCYGMDDSTAAALAADLAIAVARGDQWADDPLNFENLSTSAGTNHWQSHRQAREAIEESVTSGNPYQFGFDLHAVQDYYAHFGQGFIGETGDDGESEWLGLFFWDDRYSATGASLEGLNPLPVNQRVQHAKDWGHLNTTIRYLRGAASLDPDRFDPSDPWDQAMAEESQHYISLFVYSYYAMTYGDLIANFVVVE